MSHMPSPTDAMANTYSDSDRSQTDGSRLFQFRLPAVTNMRSSKVVLDHGMSIYDVTLQRIISSAYQNLGANNFV